MRDACKHRRTYHVWDDEEAHVGATNVHKVHLGRPPVPVHATGAPKHVGLDGVGGEDRGSGVGEIYAPAGDGDARQLAVHVVLDGLQVPAVDLSYRSRQEAGVRTHAHRIEQREGVRKGTSTHRIEQREGVRKDTNTHLAGLELDGDHMVLRLVQQLDRHADRHGC